VYLTDNVVANNLGNMWVSFHGGSLGFYLQDY